MYINRKTRLNQAVTLSQGPAVSAAPEIPAETRYDVVGRLQRRGRISAHHLDRAEEIRSVHEAVGRGMFPTAQSTMRWGSVRRRRGARDFLDRMTQSERYAWEHHYLPWTRDLATEVAAGIPGTRWLQLIIDIVVDNVPLREIETRYRLRHGTALAYLTNGLDRYNRQA